MISLDQVLLLEQKVESAVARIAQLQAENDALRRRCSELTNAFDSKSEQLSTFQLNQDKIETGIKKALDRLTSIENSVLDVVGQSNPQPTNQNPVQNVPVQNIPAQNVQTQSTQINNQVQTPNVAQNPSNQPQIVNSNTIQTNVSPVTQNTQVNSTQFYDMNPVQKEAETGTEESPDNPEDQGQFDIF